MSARMLHARWIAPWLLAVAGGTILARAGGDQRQTDLVATGSLWLDFDVDGPAAVDQEDLLALVLAWGTCAETCPDDLDGDGEVGALDLSLLIESWGLARPAGRAREP